MCLTNNANRDKLYYRRATVVVVLLLSTTKPLSDTHVDELIVSAGDDSAILAAQVMDSALTVADVLGSTVMLIV